jgi:phosphoribosylformimino-5-aminoimidazole carboxamide ribotide isomerase
MYALVYLLHSFNHASFVSTLTLIPVLDLKDGLVVHAREGRRPEYRPVQSSLCSGAAAQAVIEGFLRIFPFPVVYVADLDAIEKRGNHARILGEIRSRFPSLELWVDTGIADLAELERWIASDLGRPVIGSESVVDAEFLSAARQNCAKLAPVLSLDFVGEDFKGPPALLSDPAGYWPERVLAMNVRRVGSGVGPDLTLITALGRMKSPTCQVFAAGGVRSAADLRQIEASGAAGALIATALHDGSIGNADILQVWGGLQPE